MTQNELNRAVAAATGESVTEISARGFGLLNLRPPADEPTSRHRGRRRRTQRRERRHRHLVYPETE
jgi:hypothetical protein